MTLMRNVDISDGPRIISADGMKNALARVRAAWDRHAG
jgi:hypothetical protein